MKKGISTTGAIMIFVLAFIVHAIKMVLILLILGLITWFIVSFCKNVFGLLFSYSRKIPSEEKTEVQQEYINKNILKISINELSLDKEIMTLNVEYQHQMFIEEYFNLMNHKKQLAEEINELSNLIISKRNESVRLSNRNQAINSFSTKPMLIPKRKYLAKMSPEIKENKEKITLLENEVLKIEEQIEEKRKRCETIKLDLCDEENEELHELEIALDKFKNSKKIKEHSVFNCNDVSEEQKNNDLRYVNFNVQPYSINIDNRRFYIFSNSIWSFKGNGKLLGIFKPSALSSNFSFEEIKLDSDNSSEYVEEDTKIIIKKIPHTTWLHTRVDGTQDKRYKNNPQSTYYIDEKYYLKCKFSIKICENSLLFDVSSYDNCERLKNAINKYANHDVF